MSEAAYKTSVMASFCWQAQNWTPTARQYKYISSWASRHGACMGFVRRCPTEEIDQWWRRLHREGKKFMSVQNLVVTEQMKGAKHNFAGHLARMASGDIANQILHARHLAWWRHWQSQNQAHGRRRGDQLHPKRFCAHGRWEAAFEDFYGVHTAAAARAVVGWMRAAQDREKWRQSCQTFITS